jgi:septal ring factor EnvC (AmiA/AmiB activator)
MPGNTEALLALGGAVLGGSGLKVIEHWLNKSKDKIDVAKDFRQELRTDLSETKKELDRVEEELDKWKEKYYALLQENLELKQRKDRGSPKESQA